MAKTAPKIVNGRERKQITAFIVDVDSPGLEITYRCHFMGLRALYNGIVKFTNVRVPRENMIAKEGAGIESCPNDFEHRPPDDSGGVCRFVETAARDLPQVGEANACNGACRSGSITPSPARSRRWRAMFSRWKRSRFSRRALVDRKAGDLRIETAMCKMWATETTWRIADEAMQVRGGRGYETAQSLAGRGEEPIAVERFPARLPHQHDFRRLERNHAFVHCARSARSASQSRRRDFQHAVADVGTHQGDVQFRKILRELVSETVDSAAAPEDIEGLHDDLRAHVDYAARTSQTTRARTVPRHGAFRSEARSRTIVALALLSESRRNFSR